jgi:hypothetical protein
MTEDVESVSEGEVQRRLREMLPDGDVVERTPDYATGATGSGPFPGPQPPGAEELVQGENELCWRRWRTGWGAGVALRSLRDAGTAYR